MSVDLAREYAEAMKAHDLEQVAALLDPEATVVTPKGTVLRGPDEVRRYFGGGGFDHLEVETVHDDFEAHDALRPVTADPPASSEAPAGSDAPLDEPIDITELREAPDHEIPDPASRLVAGLGAQVVEERPRK